VPTALIFVFDNILLFTLIPFLMALGGSEKLDVVKTVKMVLWRIFSHPFNIATFIAVVAAYFQFKPPAAIDKIVNLLYGSAAPVALFALGVTVASRPVGRCRKEMPVHLLIKLVLHPVLIVLVLLSFIGGFEREWVYTAVLMAALPPALNVFVVARQYNTYIEQASTALLLGTLISIFSVTAVLYLITTNTLPYQLFGRCSRPLGPNAASGCEGRLPHAGAHQELAQRADVGGSREPGITDEIERQEPGNQRAVEQVNPEGA
jgi:malonate transporter